MTRLAIVGSGDLGELICHHASACGFEVVGFFDDFKSPEDRVLGLPILGKLDDALRAFKDDLFAEIILGIGYTHLAFRRQVFEEFSKSIPFATLVHKSCFVDGSARIAPGAVLLPGCVIDRNASVGVNTLVNVGTVLAHDVKLGAHGFIGPGCRIAGFVTTGECIYLGTGTIIIDNRCICDNCQTGAGTVVTKDLQEAGLYVGVPARRIR